MIKKNPFIVQLLLIIVIIIELIIIYSDQHAICIYKLNEDNYTKETFIKIKHNKEIEETIKIDSKHIDLLNEMKKEYKKGNIENNTLIINNKYKTNNYYKYIKSKKTYGYKCQIKF